MSPHKISLRTVSQWLAVCASVVLLVWIFRVYHGDQVGLQIVLKESPAFADTIVDVDEILGLPASVLAAEHPTVKRQMVLMGWTHTDEQIQQESKRKFEELMELSKKQMKLQVDRSHRKLKMHLDDEN